jgi:hypothetical protein
VGADVAADERVGVDGGRHLDDGDGFSEADDIIVIRLDLLEITYRKVIVLITSFPEHPMFCARPIHLMSLFR